MAPDVARKADRRVEFAVGRLVLIVRTVGIRKCTGNNSIDYILIVVVAALVGSTAKRENLKQQYREGILLILNGAGKAKVHSAEAFHLSMAFRRRVAHRADWTAESADLVAVAVYKADTAVLRDHKVARIDIAH